MLSTRNRAITYYSVIIHATEANKLNIYIKIELRNECIIIYKSYIFHLENPKKDKHNTRIDKETTQK